jgi:GTPase SAR1 family protein
MIAGTKIAQPMKKRSTEFIKQTHQLAEYCTAIQSINQKHSLRLNENSLFTWQQQIRHFELVVMGKYNAGKSTLLNLLLGLDLDDGLPTGFRPTTSKLWKISYSSKPKLKAMRFDVSEPKFVITRTLVKILDQLESGYSEQEIAEIDYYELGLPSELLKNTGWAIWDTPGKDDLGGLLNETHYERALQLAEGAVVVTNYDQFKSCSDYLLQLKEKQIECTVIALTNSAAMSPEDFMEQAETKLGQITGYLKDFFPAARYDFAIDCKDPSGASDPSRNRWLGPLQRIVEAVEKIEEPLILLRAWRSMEPFLRDVKVHLEQKIAAAESRKKRAEKTIADLQNFLQLPVTTSLEKEIADATQRQLDDRIQSKSQKLKEQVLSEMYATIEAVTPNFLEHGFSVITLGWGGRSASEIDSDLHHAFQDRMMHFGSQFIEAKVLNYLIPIVKQNASVEADSAVSNYAKKIPFKNTVTYEGYMLEDHEIKAASVDAIYQFAVEKYSVLAAISSRSNFRNDANHQQEYAEESRKVCRSIFKKSIKIIAGNVAAHLIQSMDSYQHELTKRANRRIQRLNKTIYAMNESIGSWQKDWQKMNFYQNYLEHHRSQFLQIIHSSKS